MPHCGCHCPACQAWHAIEVRLLRLENRVKTKQLLARLTPQELQHVECF
jgi:hypothetical protein